MTISDEIAAQQRRINEIKRVLSQHQLAQYKPYPKQLEFHAAGANPGIRERLLIAGNQLGKTLGASMEAGMHATGLYSSWWPGIRFNKATAGWAASITSQGTRDTVQRLLLGLPGNFGTGALPKRSILEIKKATHGVADSVETITVRHEPTGGISRITLKTYDQGRLRWQGDTLHWVWFDEEPEEEIYTEGLTRTNATGGIAFMTFTPLLGMSEVVRRFLIKKAPGTHTTVMTIEDALHYTPEQRAAIIEAYPPHERAARARGEPLLGSGRIFPFDDAMVAEAPVMIPEHWPRICGTDFGYNHPAAAVWIAWDRDTDTAHVYDCYRRKEASPVVIAGALRAKGAWIPCAWPHDGLVRDKASGVIIAQQYRDAGVNMMKDRATHAPAKGQKEGDGGSGLEAGLMNMYDRMQTGRLKVARHLTDWFEEYKMYHRKDGLVVAELDDLLSATRYALMMLRKATTKQTTTITVVPSFRPTVPGMGMLG